MAGRCPESEDVHGSRIMAVTAGSRPTWPPWWPAGLAWTLWALTIPAGCAVVVRLDQLLRQAGRPDLGLLTPNQYAYVLTLVSAATVGAVLASRRPRHPVGWLLLALGLSVVAAGVAQGYAGYGLQARPGSLPGTRWVALYSDVTPGIVWPALVGFILLLTPTGSLPSPRWRWWAIVTAAVPVVFLLGQPLLLGGPDESVTSPLAVPGLAGVVLVASIAALIFSQLAILVDVASLVMRFRHARGTERQQLRWVAMAAGLLAAAVVVTVVGALTGHPALLEWTSGLFVALLPVATGAAILRYRLYDLDRIISRTLAYGLLTVLLGGGYAAVVLGLGQLLGRDSSLVVAMATLAVAAVFQPARRRIQELVDRRFNRRRYDAVETIQAFSAPWGSETRTSCSDLVVLVNETAESVPAPNAGGDCYRIRPSPNLDTSGRPKREASVRPLTVVVPQVLVEHPLKMTPTPDQHPIQTLLPHRPHPALGERVGIRRLNRGLDDLDAVSGEDVVEGAGELGIPVTKEEPRGGRALRPFHLYREFPCPLDDPSSVRMVGDASDPDLPRMQLDEEQDVEGLEAHGLHREEVSRDDAGGLGSKERSPGGRGPPGRGPKPIAEQHRTDRGG